MAGTYRDYTSYRIAYHLDGTRVYYRSLTSPIELTPAQITILNDEDTDGMNVSRTTGYFQYLFTRPYDLTGYFVGWYGNFSYTTPYVEVSSDTTNISDGTWTNIGSAGCFNGGLSVHRARANIATISAENIIAARVRYSQSSYAARSMSFYSINFYGNPTNGVTGDKLWLWDSTIDQRISPSTLDFGNAPLSNITPVRTFRVKNSSTIKTAVAPVVAGVIPTDGSPSVASTMQFSLDNSNWDVSVTLPDMAPGAISQVVFLRFNILVNTAVGPRIPLVTLTPTNMT